ncbi:MAG: OmpA family protein [Pseudomonadota bacterium]
MGYANNNKHYQHGLVAAFRAGFACALLVVSLCVGITAHAAPFVLDWDTETWLPEGNTNLSQTYTVGGRPIVVTFGGNTPFLDQTPGFTSPALSSVNTGGLNPAEQSLAVSTNYLDNTDNAVTVTFDLSAFRGGVSDLSFSIFDLDFAPAFIDEVTVTATLTDGSIVDPTTLTGSPANTITNSNTITGTGPSPTTSANGNATFAFGQSGITQINLIYRNVTAAVPNFQWIHIHDVNFQAAQADISLIKDVDNATPSVGTDVTYTITVTNDGPDVGTGLVVTDQLPAGLTYVSDNGGGAYDNLTGEWTIGSLPVGASTSLQITATVNATGPYDNVAELTEATTDDLDSTPGNNDPTEDDQDNALITPLTQADLSLDKTVDQPEPLVGDNVTFTLTLTNDGPADTTGVTVADTLPSGFQFVSSTPSVGSYDDGTGIWTVGALAAGAVETLQIVATTLATGDHTNVAEVATSDVFDPDSTPGNNDPSEDDQSSAVVTPLLIGLAKSVSAGPINNGDGTFTLVYSLIAENMGAADLSNVQIVDDLAVTFAGAVSFTVDGTSSVDFTVNPAFDGQVNTNVLTGLDALPIGQNGSVQLTVTVEPGGNLGPYNNTATVTATGPGGTPVTDVSQQGVDPDPDNDGDPRNNNDPTPTSFAESPIIGLAKRVSTVPVSNGAGGFDLSYTVFAENLGDVPLAQLQITDNIAQTFAGVIDVTVNAVTSADFTINPNYDGTLEQNLLLGTDTLPVGGSGELVIDVTVTPDTNLGPFDNTAIVSGVSPAGTPVSDQSTDGALTDPDGDGNPGNNSVPTPVSFSENPVIGTAKVVTGTPINNGDGTFSVSYDIRVENFGDVPLSGVQITDDFSATFPAPAVFAIQSVTSTDLAVNPAFDGRADTNLLLGNDQLVVGSSGTVSVVLLITPGDALGTFNNTAVGSGTSPVGTPVQDDSNDGVDPDPDNDGNPLNNNTPTPVTLAEAPAIGLAKRVTAEPVFNNNGTFTFSYTMVATNFGDVTLNAIQITDDLATVFAQAGSMVVNAVNSADFSVNNAFDGNTDTNLLSGTDSLAPGASGELTVTLTVAPGTFGGPYLNTAIAEGTSPGNATVNDTSTDGIDPDPDGDGDPGNNSDPTPVSFALPEIVVSKRADPTSTTVGGLVRYTVTVENRGGAALNNITLQDLIPAGFTYAQGSASYVGSGDLEISGQRPVNFGGIDLAAGESGTLTYVLRVGAGVVQGDYPNIVTPFALDEPVGNSATATVRVTADPDFEETTIIGKVFADHNEDGYQDENEVGIPGVRLATVEGLIIETDAEGRYHIAGVEGGFRERGRNFIVKVDPATLPPGSEFTTENPRVKRITQGLLNRFDFGVKMPAIQTERVGRVKVKLAEIFFQPNSAEVNPEFAPAIAELAQLLKDHGGGILYIDGNADPCGPPTPARTYSETETLSYSFTPKFGVRIAALSDADKAQIDSELASWRGAKDVSILSIGHTSTVRIAPENRHEFADNYVLGQARAETVAGYVRRSLGLDTSSVQAISRGPDEPVATNATAEGRAKNRRVELIMSGARLSALVEPPRQPDCDALLGKRRADRVWQQLQPLIGDDLINQVDVLPHPPPQ